MMLGTLLNNNKGSNMFYLYKKTHNITGLKYLGQTTLKDPYTYPGSGVYWSSHLRIHGNDCTTEILKECSTKEELVYWGRYYSNLWDIVNDDQWANLIEEKGTGGDNSSCWTEDSKVKNKAARDSWNSHIKGKSYDEIHGIEKSNQIKRKQSAKLKNKKLTLSSKERQRRSDFAKSLNQNRIWTEDQISKRTNTFKKRNCNIGEKNGMKTKPESRMVIAEKNSKIHLIKNLESGEEIYVKNITRWAKDQNLNPSTVLSKFCKNFPVNGWVRLSVTAAEFVANS